MEPTHIFYKELVRDENIIFTANIVEKMRWKRLSSKKLVEYAVTGLSINQDIDSSLGAVTDTDRQEALSNLIQTLVKTKNPA